MVAPLRHVVALGLLAVSLLVVKHTAGERARRAGYLLSLTAAKALVLHDVAQRDWQTCCTTLSLCCRRRILQLLRHRSRRADGRLGPHMLCFGQGDADGPGWGVVLRRHQLCWAGTHARRVLATRFACCLFLACIHAHMLALTRSPSSRSWAAVTAILRSKASPRSSTSASTCRRCQLASNLIGSGCLQVRADAPIKQSSWRQQYACTHFAAIASCRDGKRRARSMGLQ